MCLNDDLRPNMARSNFVSNEFIWGTLLESQHTANDQSDIITFIFEPRSEKTGLRGSRPDPAQTGLCSHRKCLEA